MKKNPKLHIFFIIILILSIILLFIKSPTNIHFPIILISLIAMMYMAIIIWFTKTQDDLSKETLEFIYNFLKDKEEITSFDLNQSIDALELYNEGILPYFDSSYSKDYITYNIDGVETFSTNILLSLKQNEELEDGMYRDIFKGQVFGIFRESNLQTPIKITSNEGIDYFNNLKKDYDDIKIETASIDLNNNYNVYTKNKIDAFTYLNPERIEILNDIYKKYGFVNITVTKELVLIAIKSNKYILEEIKTLDNDYIEVISLLKTFKKL